MLRGPGARRCSVICLYTKPPLFLRRRWILLLHWLPPPSLPRGLAGNSQSMPKTLAFAAPTGASAVQSVHGPRLASDPVGGARAASAGAGFDGPGAAQGGSRSEEHTSELQS